MPSIIEIQNLSKQYDLGERWQPETTFREVLMHALRKPLRLAPRNGNEQARSREFWALRDVSVAVERGDVLGVVGRNGAGKSTLLKILSRITDPTSGSVKLRGRVASLLEVGTGFHPDLTGRENVYLNGAILGMHKAEIDRKFDEIVAFAEMEDFLDTPVKRYSSGMYVRLAFAVAAHLDPEILLIDEVLAVGDVSFQKKCLGKMGEVSRGGRTVLFVSHNMAAVEGLCSRGIVLDHGRLVYAGSPREAVQHYLQMATPADPLASHISELSERPRGSQFTPTLKRLELFTGEGEPLVGPIPIGASLEARIHFTLRNPTMTFETAFVIENLMGQRIFHLYSGYDPSRKPVTRSGEQVFVCRVPSLTLMPGEYRIRLELWIANGFVDLLEEAGRITISASDYYGSGRLPQHGLVVTDHQWELL